MALAALGALFLLQVNLEAAKADITCNFQSQFEELADVKNNTKLDGLQRIRLELKIRKDILNNVLDCVIQDALSTKAKLGEIRPSDQEDKTIQNQFLHQLDLIVYYYQNQKLKIEDLGIRGNEDLPKDIRDLVRDIKEWRANTYLPLANEAINFLIWIKNRDLIKTTEQRLTQINQTTKNLKVSDNEDIQSLLEKSRLNIETAKVGNLEAKKIFQNFPPSPKNSSLAFIKISLESLAKAYQNFFDITDAIKKILLP